MASPATALTSCRVVLAAGIAQKYSDEVTQGVHALAARHPGAAPPTLVAFLATSDPAAATYAEWTARACADVGVRFELRRVERTQLEDAILAANDQPAVHGIMVYYPVFGGGQDQYLQNCVSPAKDVEGLCHAYRRNMYHNVRFLDAAHTRKCILPCTPLAIVKVLEHLHVYNPMLPLGQGLYGKTITIANRSEVVGRPLAALLANDGALVYSVDVHDVLEFHRGPGLQHRLHQVVETTLTADEVLARADVVITGVPTPDYKCPAAKLKDGVVAINFSSEKNFDAADIKKRASIYVPSVGKVTVAMLQRNLLRLYEYQLTGAASAGPDASASAAPPN